MIFFNKRLVRYSDIMRWSLQYWGWALAIILGGSGVGCWQEIRYQPENNGQTELTSDQASQRQQTTNPETPIVAPVIQKLEEKTPAAELVVDREHVSEAIQSDQNISRKHPTDEDSSDTTQVADSLTVPSPSLSQAESLTQNTQTPNTSTANPQNPEGNRADLEPTSSLYTAWQLGSQWSMGAAIYAKGQPAERYQSILEHAESAAHSLNIEFKPLPYVVINSDPVATVVTYLLDDQGSRLTEVLARQHGVRHAALLELAIRSNLLLLVYSPQNMAKDKGLLSKEQFQTWVDRLTELVGSSQLSESIGQSLLDQLRSSAPYVDVKRAVFKLHKQVAAELKPVK
jgi:cytoskeletal protein RodZ